MKREGRHPIWNWVIHTPWVLAVICILSVIGFFGSGAGNPLIQRYVIRRLQTATGTRVDLAAISIRWLSLEATLKGLVIHGTEPAGTEALFAADEVRASVRIDSFWGRKVSLDELYVKHPLVHIRVERDGSMNLRLPGTSGARKKVDTETLLDLRVRRVQIENGWVLYNDVGKPLAVEGGDMHLMLVGGGSAERPSYLGTFEWKALQFTAKRFLPLPMNVAAKFTVLHDGFTVEQVVLNAARSRVDAQVQMHDFTNPQWTFRYRGWINLLDLHQTLRSQETPTGLADFRGEATYANGQFHGTGAYSGHDINLDYRPIYHAKNLSSRGTVRIDNKGLEVPDFVAVAYGGTVKGRVTLRFDGLLFRADTHVEGAHLGGVLPDIEHAGFPADELHWDTLISADTVETWTGGFEHFAITAKMQWNSPDEVPPGHIPVDGEWEIRYRYDSQTLDIMAGDFETPETRGSITGKLAPHETSLDVRFDTGALESYRDFINAVRDAAPNSPDAIKVISGNAKWEGRIVGPSGRPLFIGHFRGENVRYEDWTLDALEGDLTYSPEQLTLARGRVQRGGVTSELELNLFLTDWSFLPESNFSADATIQSTPIEALQQLMGMSYPVRGQLSGQFHGRGTRAHPSISSLFDLADGDVYGVVFNRLRGQLMVTPFEARISNAELRLFAPGKEASRGAGVVTGSAGYTFADKTVAVDLVGASLPLSNFEKLQSSRFPVDGQVSFRVKASGLVTAPQAEGTFRVVDLRVGQAVIGSFDGALNSDGRVARLKLGSAMSIGELSGNISLGLADPFPVDGKVSIKDINLDPFLLSALHLRQFNGHGKAEGEIAAQGNLRHPETLIVDANFSHLSLTYANVQLENVGPVRFRSSHDNLEIESAAFKGTDTNIQVSGRVQFTDRRAIDMRLNGALDLRLLSSLAPGLSSGGSAQIDGIFEGTLDNPRVTGRIHIENASARVADFPTGLSAIKGDFFVDATRIQFDNLTALAGGGTLHLSGTVNYTERPIRYDITARSDSTRIRYPEGMSWLTAGTLRLTGTTDGGLLSGRVTVERVTLTQGLEAAGSLISTKEDIAAPSTSSPFLRNLQFDIEAVSTPDARMQWPGAELEAEAALRVRGTWEHPIILGHIHVLSGELLFHGNRYRVARGDINFSNPFRLDPTINVEATTTIQQYEITLNFTGPSSKLTLAYRSDPPLPGNDIVTLLALGQTSAEGTSRSAGNTQSSTAGASALLSEAVSSQVGGRLEKLFGITNFRVDPALTTVGSTGSNQNAAARVTVQQRVTRNMTITYVSNVGSTQEQVIQVEYNVNRNISIVALRDYNGTFGVDIKIKKRFP
jgi:translocation and assembly module TamB